MNIWIEQGDEGETKIERAEREIVKLATDRNAIKTLKNCNGMCRVSAQTIVIARKDFSI